MGEVSHAIIAPFPPPRTWLTTQQAAPISSLLWELFSVSEKGVACDEEVFKTCGEIQSTTIQNRNQNLLAGNTMCQLPLHLNLIHITTIGVLNT